MALRAVLHAVLSAMRSTETITITTRSLGQRGTKKLTLRAFKLGFLKGLELFLKAAFSLLSRSWPIFDSLPKGRSKRQLPSEASNQATNAGSMFGLNTYFELTQ